MIKGQPLYNYDITTMRDNREFMFFDNAKFTYETALQVAKQIILEDGYSNWYAVPTEQQIETLWVKNNPRFHESTHSEDAYLYSDPSDPDAYTLIGIELFDPIARAL